MQITQTNYFNHFAINQYGILSVLLWKSSAAFLFIFKFKFLFIKHLQFLVDLIRSSSWWLSLYLDKKLKLRSSLAEKSFKGSFTLELFSSFFQNSAFCFFSRKKNVNFLKLFFSAFFEPKAESRNQTDQSEKGFL